ncbi:MAG: LLM class flavin-dependent oxidoreductase [Chloroflexi bacterium]|nr:LLM class flavin-dependent oxidoreductase [Chloroflexota bacterium]
MIAPEGPFINPDFTARFAQAHEQGGFDRILIGYGAGWAEGWGVANAALRATDRLKVLIAHRPGFVAPTLFARQASTLDHITGGGRVAIHYITGGDEIDQRRDGDFLSHDDRYRRTGEFLTIVRRLWSEGGPLDFAGEFYRVEGAIDAVRPATPGGIPVYFGGASEAAVRVGAEHADVYMLWGEPLADIADRLATLRGAAAEFGRTLRFSVSLRPILGPTEAKAWARAEAIAETTAQRRDAFLGHRVNKEDTSVGARRLREAAAVSDVHDERLFTRVAAITGASGNSTALVGTPEQVAESLLKYVDLGFSTILIRGFNPLQDAADYGRELLPLVRAGMARREREPVLV